MARRKAIATGNFTTAGTWGLVDATMYGQSETSAVVCPTAYSNVARSAQTTPGAIVVSHIMVKLAVRTGTTGTITVHIANSAHVEVAGTAVTINTADLPVAATADINGGWHAFKLATPVTLAAATLYEVEARTSSASQVSLFASAATNGLSHAIVTTTTGAPAAGDDLFVGGEYTGAGTSNSFTVTMDNTATTDFGSGPTAANSLLGPGIAICNKGTLTFGTTAATNYYLKLSNSLIVYSGGTLNIGTVATAIPRDSTAVLEFDPAADNDYGLTVRNLGTFVAQGLSRTSGKDIVSCKLNTDEAAAQTTLGVDTDTGWLNGDDIAIASTTRTASQTEKRTLNANANASDMTVSAGLTNAHSGTSPTQAEVILLTRNVKIRSATSTLMAYGNFKATSQVDVDWVQFNYFPSPSLFETTTGSGNVQYCSFSDSEIWGVGISGTTANNVVFSNNVLYNVNSSASTGGAGFIIGNATSGTSITVSNNILMLIPGDSNAIHLADIGGTITNNTVVSSTGGTIRGAFSIQENNAVGTFSGNVAHSCTNSAFLFNSGGASLSGTFGLTAWRNSGSGIFIRVSVGNVTFSSPVLFGNTTQNILIAGASTISISQIIINSGVINSDASFSTTNGIMFTGTNLYNMKTFINSTLFGTTTAHTNDISFAGTPGYPIYEIYLNNTTLGSGTEVSVQTNLFSSLMVRDFIKSSKHDQTAGSYKSWFKYGTITRETTTVHTGSQSIKMTPNNASNKLESGSFKVAVASGATLTPTVYVYEDASYNGARARLILKRNDAIGITADTVIDTATAASDAAWEGLTGTTAAATDDGVMEFVVDCDGTAGNLFVDSFTVA